MSVNLKNYVNQYEFPFTIPSTADNIVFKPITTGQMKNLLIYEDESVTTVEKILDDVIKGCVITNGFNLDVLKLQDRFSLLIEIRRKSKGSAYNFETKCIKCGVQGPKGVELDKLENIPFNPDVDKVIKISDSMTIEIDYITRRHQRMASEIVEKTKGLNQNQMLAQIASYTYAFAITKFITPDGDFTQDDVNVADVVDMLDSISEQSYQHINNWFIDNDYGTVFKAEYMCGSCGHKETIDIPVSYFFS